MKKMLLTVLAVALSVAMIAAATMAWFTDEDAAGEATFTAGVLDVNVTDGMSTLIDVGTINHMNPGDSFGPVTIDIVNEGTKKLAWFGDWIFTPGTTGEDKLLDALYIKTMKMEMLDETGAKWTTVDPWYGGDEFIQNGTGALYSYNAGQDAWYDSLAALSAFNVVTLRNFNDNNDMIVLPGAPWEHMGALKAGNKYRLTVEFGFHKDAKNEYQGDRELVSPIKIGFKVDATQVNAEAINSEIMTGLGTAHIGWLEAQIAVQPD